MTTDLTREQIEAAELKGWNNAIHAARTWCGQQSAALYKSGDDETKRQAFVEAHNAILALQAPQSPPSDVVVEAVADAVDKAILVNSVNPQGVEKVRINVARAALKAMKGLDNGLSG